MEDPAAASPDLPAAPPPEDPSSSCSPSASSQAGAASPGPRELAAAMEAVERDAAAIADSYASLFASLRIALSNTTSTSAENMECLGDVVGRLQESALEASSKGNKYINSCLRLNEEMRGLDSLAMQLKILRKNVDTLDLAGVLLDHLQFSKAVGSLLKKFTVAAGTLWRNRGCLIQKNPRQSAVTWNGVTYSIIAVNKQNNRNIDVALGSLQPSSDCNLSP
ncbi:hypothetical protein GUJ93_ZPchr0013g35752 [Zizania palustris]|uniref:BLOC-1-related complex subunit 6 C-terminal helix domain-containing protein n=1 Tax=Zizania palustris TaxID=103762 RepID=A0A8J6BY84_ZIZPA|nr:hypothetical protein GUJ93_ZPchr0013g35752 [Zizania palustris]